MDALDLLVTRWDGTYHTLLRSSVGEARATFALGESLRTRAAAPWPADAEALDAFGRAFFAAALTGDVLDLYRRTQQKEPAGELSLRIQPPELHSWRWEALHDGEHRLASGMAVVRRPELLRVGGAEVRVSPLAADALSPTTLSLAMENVRAKVLHLSGLARVDEKSREGELVSGGQAVRGSALAKELEGHADLRLVILSSDPADDEAKAREALMRVAAAMVQMRVRAVLVLPAARDEYLSRLAPHLETRGSIGDAVARMRNEIRESGGRWADAALFVRANPLLAREELIDAQPQACAPEDVLAVAPPNPLGDESGVEPVKSNPLPARFEELRNLGRSIEAVQLWKTLEPARQAHRLAKERLSFCLNRIAEIQEKLDNRRQARLLRERAAAALESIPAGMRTFDTFGAAARIYKGWWQTAKESSPELGRKLLDEAIRSYEDGFVKTQAYYLGVNAVTLRLARGMPEDREAADDLRPKVVALVAQERVSLRAKESVLEEERYWQAATEMELAFASRDWDAAGRSVEESLGAATRSWWVGTTLDNLKLLPLAGGEPRAEELIRRLREKRDSLAQSEGGNSDEHTLMQCRSARPTERVPVLLRVSDPNWAPLASMAGDIDVGSRIGSVIACSVAPKALRDLESEDDPRVLSVEASRRGISEEDGEPRDVAPPSRPAPKLPAARRKVLVAVVDTGVDVLHESFIDPGDGSTCMVGYWDMAGAPLPDRGRGSPSKGAFYDAVAIQAMVKANTVPVDALRDPRRHGTQVASIAVGRRNPVGVAPEAGLLVVAVPPRVGDDVGGSGFGCAIVEALSFIDEFAGDLPVVVNLSNGINAGAHDGSSAVEIACNDFCARSKGRFIVKSTGNDRLMGAHAKLDLLPKLSGQFVWTSATGRRGPDLIEVWFPVTDQLRFSLSGPDVGSAPARLVVDLDHPEIVRQPIAGNVASMRFRHTTKSNPDSQLTILIEADPDNPQGKIADGKWTLTVNGRQLTRPRTLHAWTERWRQAGGLRFEPSDPGCTLTIPGTASSVISVGASAPFGDPDDGGSTQTMTAAFSSHGPSRNRLVPEQPVVMAPGNDIVGAKSGTRSGAFQNSGTSFAAPQITGAIALLVATHEQGAAVNQQQLRAAILASLKSSGDWTPDFGYGEIDLEKLLAFRRF